MSTPPAPSLALFPPPPPLGPTPAPSPDAHPPRPTPHPHPSRPSFPTPSPDSSSEQSGGGEDESVDGSGSGIGSGNDDEDQQGFSDDSDAYIEDISMLHRTDDDNAEGIGDSGGGSRGGGGGGGGESWGAGAAAAAGGGNGSRGSRRRSKSNARGAEDREEGRVEGGGGDEEEEEDDEEFSDPGNDALVDDETTLAEVSGAAGLFCFCLFSSGVPFALAAVCLYHMCSPCSSSSCFSYLSALASCCVWRVRCPPPPLPRLRSRPRSHVSRRMLCRWWSFILDGAGGAKSSHGCWQQLQQHQP